MGNKDGSHVRIGPYSYRLDESQEVILEGRKPRRRWTKSLFGGKAIVGGKPGADSLDPDTLLWQLTDFGGGEGQLVIESTDPDSVRTFYRSEGLDFRTPGEFRLNRSNLLTRMPVGAISTSTKEGAADFSDQTGTSTTTLTDRQLATLEDEVVSSVAHTPGAGTVQADFWGYHESVALTTITGGAMVKVSGEGEVSGTDYLLRREQAKCRTTSLSSLTVGSTYNVNWFVYASNSSFGDPWFPKVVFRILNVTNADNPAIVYESPPVGIKTATTPLSPSHTASFVPRTGKSYQFRVEFVWKPSNFSGHLIVDYLTYGVGYASDNAVTCSVYETTTGAGTPIAVEADTVAQQMLTSRATSITITKPTGTVSGDLLVAWIVVRDGLGEEVYTEDPAINGYVTAPAGWTAGGRTRHGRWYYRVAGASEGASYAWTFAQGTPASPTWVTEGYMAGGQIFRITGFETTPTFEDEDGQFNNSQVGITIPSLTSATNNALALWLFAKHPGGEIGTAPAGTTVHFNQDGGQGMLNMMSAWEKIGTAGATGTRTATSDSKSPSIGMGIIVKAATPTAATIRLIESKTVSLTNLFSVPVCSITFTTAAATDYTYRFKWASGSQKPWLDKVVLTLQSSTATVYTPEIVALGQGGNVWLAASASGAAPKTWTYDFSTELWTERRNLTGATASSTVTCEAHTDKYQYFGASDKKVYQLTTAADDDYTAAHTGALVGMCIAQDRLWVLTEDATNGVDIFAHALDSDVSGGALAIASAQTAAIETSLNTPTTTLRQRMASGPDGVFFFVNYSGVTAKIFKADRSSGSILFREVNKLDEGAIATCIAHSAGMTFIGGQFKAETGSVAQSALWMIDQNGFLQRLGYFRRDDPNPQAPQYIQVYGNDVWILQGSYIWRYSLISGGMFLEYKLTPGDETKQRSLAILADHQFAAFNDEGVWVTGAVRTYRVAGANVDASRFISSVHDFDLPAHPKVLTSMAVLTDNLDENTSVTVEYQKDQSGNWEHVGTATTGSFNAFRVSDADETILFNNLQVRATPTSGDGVSSPRVKAISAQALAQGREEFFDLALLCTDEGPEFHIEGRVITGAELARNIHTLRRSGELVTFVDAYASEDPDENDTYLVKVEDVQDDSLQQGESRIYARLRVIQT